MDINQYQDAVINTGGTFLSIPASGNSALLPFDCDGTRPAALIFPSNWTSCDVSFLVLPWYVRHGVDIANDNLVALLDGTSPGELLSFTVAENQCLPLNLSIFNTVRFINIRTSVPQAEAVQVDLALVPIWQGVHG